MLIKVFILYGSSTASWKILTSPLSAFGYRTSQQLEHRTKPNFAAWNIVKMILPMEISKHCIGLICCVVCHQFWQAYRGRHTGYMHRSARTAMRWCNHVHSAMIPADVIYFFITLIRSLLHALNFIRCPYVTARLNKVPRSYIRCMGETDLRTKHIPCLENGCHV